MKRAGSCAWRGEGGCVTVTSEGTAEGASSAGWASACPATGSAAAGGPAEASAEGGGTASSAALSICAWSASLMPGAPTNLVCTMRERCRSGWLLSKVATTDMKLECALGMPWECTSMECMERKTCMNVAREADVVP